MPGRLFDPLLYLENELRCRVSLEAAGEVRLQFDRQHSDENIRKAKAVAKRYARLLALQLREGRKSVQKLMAHGKIRLVAGQYRLPTTGREPTI